MNNLGVQVDTDHTLTTLDGWKLEWDLERTPQAIIAYNEEGVQQWHLSGEIDWRSLEREKSKFLGEHGPEQLRLF